MVLPGKPVAVTSNRGQGRGPVRPGANPQLEMEYYQKKYTHPQAGEIVITVAFTGFYMSSPSVTKRPLSVHLSESAADEIHTTPSQESPDCRTNGVEQDAVALSMAEIASCSYEAR